MDSKISRRGLMQGMFAGFVIPAQIPAPTKLVKGDFGLLEPGAALWCVFVAGNGQTTNGFKAFEEGRRSAEEAGFEVLDSLHQVNKRSRFLARKEVTESYARELEKWTITEPAYPGLHDIADGIIALWVEVA